MPTWYNATKNQTTVNLNNYINFNTTWTDDFGLSSYIFSINQTGTFVNSSAIPFTGTLNTSTNVTQITAAADTVVEWLFYANDTENNWNQTALQTFTVAAPTGTLLANLSSPTGTNSQPQNQTFLLFANVSCQGQAGATCGTVNGTARYNLTTSPNTTITGFNVFANPFYTIGPNPQTCGTLAVGDAVCSLNWTVNTTGVIGDGYKIDANFTSTTAGVTPNATDFTTVNIISPTLSITLSDALLDVVFGVLNPGTDNNAATNNSANWYNVTCSYAPGNCNISIKGNSDFVSGANKLAIGNASRNTANNPATEKVLTLNYEVINATLAHLAIQKLYFWLDIPGSLVAGTYLSNFTIQGQPN